MKTELISALNAFNINPTQEQIEKILAFHALLLEWNQKINLTSITTSEEAITKHYLDSLLLSNLNLNLSGKSVCDVGTGAGFPGIPLAIFFTSASFILMDAVQKKLSFVNFAIEKLNLQNVNTVHIRAEDAGKKQEFREKFDIVTSRALASLNVLSEYLLPLVKLNGQMIAYKGKIDTQEIQSAKHAISLLGGGETTIINMVETENLTRNFIIIPKLKPTPKQYPRKSGLPKSNPL